MAAVILCLVTLEAYWPAINGPFVFDDEYLPFRDPNFLTTFWKNLSPTARPLLHLSFWFNLNFLGAEPFSYHLVNILIHLLNGGLMFFSVRKLLEMAAIDAASARLLGAFASAVFLLHPVNTESVAYVAGRSESVSLFFFLSSFTLFLYKREGGIQWPAAAGVLVFFGAAFLSKEHTAVLPALLLLTDWCFPVGKPADTIRRNWRVYAPMVLLGLIGGILAARVLAYADSAGFAMKDLPWHDYFFTQWRALWVYLRLFLFPATLNADYEFPISRSPMDHGAIFGLLSILALTAVAFVYRKRFPLAFYGLIVFFLLIAPTSSVVPIKDPIAERRLYLPFLGLLLVVCDFASRWKPSLLIRVSAMGALVLALTGLTYARAEIWANPEKLWEDTAAKSPGNYRAHFQLAMVYYEQQRCPEALKKFEDAARIKPKDYTLLLDWGLSYNCLSQFDKALEKFRQAAAIENTGHVHSLIGMILARQNQPGAALEELNLAVKMEPGYDMAYAYRGEIYLMLNQLQQSESDFRQALTLNAGNEQARQGLARLAAQKGPAR